MGDYGSLSSRIAAQEASMRNEEANLAGLGADVGNAKNMTTAILAEADLQNDLLDDLENALERSNNNARGATQRADGLERSPYTIKNFISLLGPLVFLLVMALFMLRHWILGI